MILLLYKIPYTRRAQAQNTYLSKIVPKLCVLACAAWRSNPSVYLDFSLVSVINAKAKALYWKLKQALTEKDL